MLIRQPIRNNDSAKDAKPRIFDALIDEDEVYLEIKNAKQKEIVRLTDVLRQIEEAQRRAGYQKS